MRIVVAESAMAALDVIKAATTNRPFEMFGMASFPARNFEMIADIWCS